ncbi:non-oxidative hydroxyarylic acid decarboxylases subunit D [Streptomyces kronopolitis]|uniref:non-oxidative hydroxyarylic acid decarboxylases subunit D n=1 Tax=Streptomyces kronopolitis TaxID=1612435 RepID=UPI003419B640
MIEEAPMNAPMNAPLDNARNDPAHAPQPSASEPAVEPASEPALGSSADSRAGSPSNSSWICPRCACDAIATVATSPVPGVWDVLRCERCCYLWRSTEPARRTRREAYPVEFRMSGADLDNAPEVPAVPPLEAR